MMMTSLDKTYSSLSAKKHGKNELLPENSVSVQLGSSSIGGNNLKQTVQQLNEAEGSKTQRLDSNKFDIKFNFELLRIQSRQFRNSITFNSILYFTLIALFMFIIILHYRYSSPHYSVFSFCSNICWIIFHGRDRMMNLSSSNESRVHHSSLSQRMDLGYIFNEFRRGPRRHDGFNRLPQNESEAIDYIDDDDDEEDIIVDRKLRQGGNDDDGSDVLEDFNKKTHSKIFPNQFSDSRC